MDIYMSLDENLCYHVNAYDIDGMEYCPDCCCLINELTFEDIKIGRFPPSHRRNSYLKFLDKKPIPGYIRLALLDLFGPIEVEFPWSTRRNFLTHEHLTYLLLGKLGYSSYQPFFKRMKTPIRFIESCQIVEDCLANYFGEPSKRQLPGIENNLRSIDVTIPINSKVTVFPAYTGGATSSSIS